MKKRIFGFHPATYVDEFFGLIRPLTVLVFKSKKKMKYTYDVDDRGIEKLTIPKLTKGKWGNEHLPGTIDYIWYSLVSTFMFPYVVLKYDKILFHAPPFFEAHLIPLFRLFGKKTYVVVIDEQLPLNKVNVIKQAYYIFARVLEHIAVLFSTKTFATSQYLYKKYKHYKKDVIYTPNGADVSTIAKITKKRKFKEFTVTYLGGMESWRGVDMLIEAFKEARNDSKKNMKLLIMGGGPDFGRVKAIAEGDEDITLTNYIPHNEAIAYCKGSDVLVMPSKNCLASRTISSIKCFEYIACGIPSIVTDSGEHAEWTKKLGTGIVVPDTKDGIKKALLLLRKDANKYSAIQKRCLKNRHEVDYRKFKKIFSQEVMHE